MKCRFWLAVGCLLLACGGAYGEAVIGEAAFPDAVFREYVRGFDLNGDGELSTAELGAVTSIDVTGMGIGSLTGIEHFTGLVELQCFQNS